MRALAAEQRQAAAAGLRLRWLAPEVAPGRRRRDAPARRAHEESLLDQEGLDDVLERVALLAERGGEAVDADRATRELLDHREQEAPVQDIEAFEVDFQEVERALGHFGVDAARRSDLREVTDAPQQAIGDA